MTFPSRQAFLTLGGVCTFDVLFAALKEFVALAVVAISIATGAFWMTSLVGNMSLGRNHRTSRGQEYYLLLLEARLGLTWLTPRKTLLLFFILGNSFATFSRAISTQYGTIPAKVDSEQDLAFLGLRLVWCFGMFLTKPTLFAFLPVNSLMYGLLVIELNTQFKPPEKE